MVKSLARAKVKSWVLTGDSVEHAVHVAKACNLIEKSYKLLRLTEVGEKAGVMEMIDQQKSIRRKKALLLEGIDCLDSLSIAKECEVVVVGKLTP